MIETLKLTGRGVIVGVAALVTFYSGLLTLPKLGRFLTKSIQLMQERLPSHLIGVAGGLIFGLALAGLVIEVVIRRTAHRKLILALSVLCMALGIGAITIPPMHSARPRVGESPRHRHPSSRNGSKGGTGHAKRGSVKAGRAKARAATHAEHLAASEAPPEEATSSAGGGESCTCSGFSTSSPPAKTPCGCSAASPATGGNWAGGSEEYEPEEEEYEEEFGEPEEEEYEEVF